MKGFMTRDEAERAIWSWYWQLDNSRDRRVAPMITEPPENLSKEELKRIRDAQTPAWRKAQLKAVDILERRSSRVGGYARKLSSLFTTEAERQYLAQCQLNEEQQRLADQDLTGKVDPLTGLPLTTNDLQSGRGVVSGVDLCLEAIVSPYDLAENLTSWLPPCPLDHDPGTWGDELEHWESLAYKPKDLPCGPCKGTGRVTKTVTADVIKGVLFRRNKTERRSFQAACEECKGSGSKQYWDDEEFQAVRHNAQLIARVVHELARDKYFDLRPIDSRDVEMGDLVWESRDGHTIGFRLSWEGYKRMKEFADRDPDMRQAIHILTYAGRARDSAPQWAKDEIKQSNPIKVSGAGLHIPSTPGGFVHSGGNMKL